MAEGTRIMVIYEHPEIKLAKRIIAKHSLSIPFDIQKLISLYADLEFKDIPIEGIDGVSINLKVQGKTPKIIVNSSIPSTRINFTLAHELGHIIIPWHLGTIVDDLYSENYKDSVYKELEHEANRFAAELLMPSDWIISEFEKWTDKLANFHVHIAEMAKVSYQAASIKLIDNLPSHIVYVLEENCIVLQSMATSQTHAFIQEVGSTFNEEQFPYVCEYSSFCVGNKFHHWYKLSTKVQIESQDERSWREILEGIVNEIKPSMGKEKFKKSINGIISFIHGKLKTSNKEEYSIESVTAAVIYRLRRDGLKEFVSHPDFETFVQKRTQDFFIK